MSPRFRSVRALLAVLAFAPCARAQFAPASGFQRAEITVHTTGAATRTLGWHFRALQDLEVTAIGVFDAELAGAPAGGLATPKLVGLFDLAENLLALGEVGAGAQATLCQDGFRYVGIPPTLLAGGAEYVVAAYWPGASGTHAFDVYPDVHNSGAPVAFHPSVDFVQPRFALGDQGLRFPSGALPGMRSFLGALTFRIGAGECEPNPPADLVTTFAGDNGFAGAMFDLRALDPGGITLDGFQVNLGDVAPQDEEIEVAIWWRHGTYLDAVGSPAGWNALGSARVRSWGTNQPTPVPLGGLALAAGETLGLYVALAEYLEHPPQANVPVLHYTAIGPAAASYADTHVELTGGAGKGAPPFMGPTIPARMWNGGLRYSLGTQPFQPFCAGDGSAAACPCLNQGGPGEGCAHGAGHGATLSATGTDSLASGGARLAAHRLPPGRALVFFQGENRIAQGAGLPFADGLRCVGGGVLRLELALSDPAGEARTALELPAAGGVGPGDARHYQVWYRDPTGTPCGAGSNLTPALTIAWAP